MKGWVMGLGIMVVAAVVVFAAFNFDMRAKLTKCEESVLSQQCELTTNGAPAGSAVVLGFSGRCQYPARVMRIKGVWMCSCRSEEETKRGIE